MTHREAAEDAFRRGYNCAQSIAVAFRDEICMTESEAARTASGFGGGMGRSREVCGALSGAVLVLGILYGYETPGDDDAKGALYARVQTLFSAFRALHETVVCRELLAGIETDASPVPTKRDETFYQTRPCLRLIGDVAEILGQYLEKYPPAKVEYSCGTIPFREKDGEYVCVLVREKNGNVGLPKGHRESGETEIETALRETKEEILMEAGEPLPGFRERLHYPLPRGREKDVTFFLVPVEGTPGAGDGILEILELPMLRAIDTVTYRETADVIRRAYEFLLMRE